MAEQREAFVELVSRLNRPGADVLERLKLIRNVRGTVGVNDLQTVARESGLPVAAVAGAASFYADVNAGRRGRRHFRICEGTSCVVATGDDHIERLERALDVQRNECSPDGSISLQTVRCLGFCYASPAALEDDIPRVGADLGGLLRDAEPGPTGTGALRGGATEDLAPEPPIPYAAAVEHPVLLAGLLRGETPWLVWAETLARGTVDRVFVEVRKSGLRGRGGAAFPVAAKWMAAAREPAPRCLVVNGDEGDPGSYCDRLLMEHDPHRILEGMALTAAAIGASHGIVLVRSEYPAALKRMRAAVAEARADGHLGQGLHGSSVDFDVEVVEGAGSYVAGEETALLRALEGLRGEVRARPPFPTTRGYLGRPTVVNNVETIAAVPWIVRHGGAAYASIGASDEPGTKLVCLSALFRRPGVYEVELGVSLRHVVEDLGGGLRAPHVLRALQIGGPLGGFLSPDHLDLPLLSTSLAGVGAALGHGSLVAIPASMPPLAIVRHLWAFGAAESCGACGPCRVGTRRGLELAESTEHGRQAPERARTATTENAIGTSSPAVGPSHSLLGQRSLADVMSASSMCAFGRGVADAIRSLLAVYQHELGETDVDAHQ